MKLGARWPVSDEQEPGPWPRFGDDRQRIGQIGDVLLRGDPAHITDHHLVRGDPERFADGFAVRSIGPEKCGVDSAGPEHEPLEVPPRQVINRRARGDVGLERAIVKPAEILPDDRLRPAHAVMRAVLVEVRVEARDGRQLSRQDVPQHAQSQGRLGRDVNDVGREPVDRAMHSAKRRQRDVQFPVKRR